MEVKIMNSKAINEEIANTFINTIKTNQIVF